jgi:hypothetical protein
VVNTQRRWRGARPLYKNIGHGEEITLLAARYRLPAIYPWRILHRTRRPLILRK